MAITTSAIRVAAVAVASFTLGHAHAHHSYAMFDRCHSTTLEGEIIRLEWVNPHVVINVRTQDVDDYRIEWLSATQVSGPRWNVPAGTLNVGDRLMVVGHAMRDPNLKVLSLVSEIQRPRDGWAWSRGQQPAPAACEAG